MDTFAKQLKPFLKRYKFILLALVLGLILMVIPTDRPETIETPEPAVSDPDICQQLEEILSKVQGVGKVRVMLTQETNQRYQYAADEDRTQTDTAYDLRRQIVVITGADRTQEGLIEQVYSPRYRGAIVVCQGGDQSSVRLAVVEAVANITGLTTDKITVLKMK